MEIKGFDTSKWQASKVNYAAAKANGYSFVILRIGCGSTKDKCFEKDYASAKAAGLKIGVYYYTKSTDISGARIDANRVLGWLGDKKLDLPIGYDVEDAVQKGVNRRFINSSMMNVFATMIKATGHMAMLYTGESFYNSYFDKTAYTGLLWIAKYSTKKPVVGRDIDMWQYSSSADANCFYTPKLDKNICYREDWFRDVVSDIPTIVVGNPYPEPTRLLKLTVPRTTGNDVRWLQYELGITVDGVFGPKTKEAVIDFQKKHDLAADGKVGAVTRRVLKMY